MSNGSDIDASEVQGLTEDLLIAVADCAALYSAFEQDWQAGTAEGARERICNALEVVATNDRYWADLRSLVDESRDDYIVEALRGANLGQFENLERDLLIEAGVDGAVAASWASASADLLRIVANSYSSDLPPHVWADMHAARAHARLAVETLCGGEFPVSVEPLKVIHEGDAPEQVYANVQNNRWKSKRFRNALWGSIRVAGGIGMTAANALSIAGATPFGLTIPVGVLTSGSILSSFWVTVGGAEKIHDALADQS